MECASSASARCPILIDFSAAMALGWRLWAPRVLLHAKSARWANFSTLCTRQNSRHCWLTLSMPRKLQRASRFLCCRLANTGSAVMMRWL